jgi:tripeptidyl-peptidase-1
MMAPLGFINPLLYQLANPSQASLQAGGKNSYTTAFNDVTEGENKCSARAEHCCPSGFNACAGWDAVTGVGTPNFDGLRQLLKADPCQGLQVRARHGSTP